MNDVTCCLTRVHVNYVMIWKKILPYSCYVVLQQHHMIHVRFYRAMYVFVKPCARLQSVCVRNERSSVCQQETYMYMCAVKILLNSSLLRQEGQASFYFEICIFNTQKYIFTKHLVKIDIGSYFLITIRLLIILNKVLITQCML